MQTKRDAILIAFLAATVFFGPQAGCQNVETPAASLPSKLGLKVTVRGAWTYARDGAAILLPGEPQTRIYVSNVVLPKPPHKQGPVTLSTVLDNDQAQLHALLKEGDLVIASGKLDHMDTKVGYHKLKFYYMDQCQIKQGAATPSSPSSTASLSSPVPASRLPHSSKQKLR